METFQVGFCVNGTVQTVPIQADFFEVRENGGLYFSLQSENGICDKCAFKEWIYVIRLENKSTPYVAPSFNAIEQVRQKQKTLGNLPRAEDKQ
jgi:hypothetical protein